VTVLSAQALNVPCPDCMAPVGTPCIGDTHAARVDSAMIQATLREGTCLLCGQRLVRYQLHGQDVAVHPDPGHADVCPAIPDPQRDLAGWSTAINLGLEPGKPGIENWQPASDESGERATGPYNTGPDHAKLYLTTGDPDA
jgi:hypothetical protein